MASTSNSPVKWARGAFLALLPAFACFLGGATNKWAEGIVVALLGAYLLVSPPRRSLGWLNNVILLGFVATAAMGLLPARWFATPDWRTALTADFGIALPTTVSPQPWLTFGCFISLVAGVCWLYVVCAEQNELRVVRYQLRLFAGAIAALAALSLLCYLAHFDLPFWKNARHFGPFPNRNQTADLFGVVSVIILACGQDDLRYRRKRWLFWLLALAVIVTAIIVNFSRAGIVLLVITSALWVAIVTWRIGSSHARRGAVPLALAASFLLLLFSALLISGGSTLERFHLQRFAGSSFPSDFRWLIFHDAWRLIASTPWCGLGLGNFEWIFAIFRDASGGNTRAFHPESDWLWLWSEAGWLSVAFVVAGFILLARRVWPLGEGTNQRFRIAALIGAIMVALHGLVDVSGHRVGTAYAGIFLLGACIYRPVPWRRSRWLPWLFRLLGIALLVSGMSWTVAWRTKALLPGGVGVANAKESAIMDTRGRNFREADRLTTLAMQWAPLDWELYYLRAVARLGQHAPWQSALDDFRRARFLEPNSYSVPLQEGIVWLSVKPELSLIAWREALHRAKPEDRSGIFSRIFFNAAVANPNTRDVVEKLAFSQHDLVTAYLEQLPRDEFRRAVARLLQSDPDLHALHDSDKRRLFQLWRGRGDKNVLANLLAQHPAWAALAWRAIAQTRAESGDFRGACELMTANIPAPRLPPVVSGQSPEQLREDAYRGANNYDAGYALFRSQMDAGKTDDALSTVRHFTDTKNAPAYFHFLEAQAWAAKQDWERSWKAWLAFERTSAR
ncbi:MAG: O-antigen ligase family protein [Verrucomicrobiota bacterium]|nr:O-antigen ligase family protein [Verrucomicrobiota bacterium]